MYNFPVKLPLRLDWSEMDMFGHINNVSYFKYIQASRVNYWEAIALIKIFEEDKIGPILLSTSCQFMKPLHYPGNITIQASIEFIKNTSFGIYHQVLNQDNEVAAEAHDVIVIYDFNKNEKALFPERFKKAVSELEGRTF
ncbi:MAG: acyl-CoA thioesterase [Flavipsychrobacter sp.]|nr:acyl-CoA thioesterase [Flavipsychrobacter sp.]